MVSETHIFSPKIINEFRAGFNRINIDFTPNATLNPINFGIGNGITTDVGLPQISIAGLGLTFGGPPLVTLIVAIVWGVTIIADSAQFSTAITELSPAAYVGTALTTQTCVGFALTMVSIWLVPPLVARAGWRWAFATLAIGPVLGVLAMGRLRGMPEAVKLAGGRR